MDEFGCVFADDADAKKFSVGARKNELEHACGVAGDVAPRVIFVKSAADNVIEFLFLAGFFGFSGGGDFRNGVNAHGKQRGDALFVLQVKGVADGDAALLHGSGSERGETDHVARGVDVRNHGAIVLVHGDVAAIVDRETGFFESEAIDSGAAAGGEERGVGFEDFTAFHCESHATRRVFGFDGAFVKQEMHADVRKAITQAIGNLVVKKWKQTIAAVYEGDVDSKRLEDGGIFTANDAAANDGEAFWDAVHLQKSVRVERVNVIESDLRGAMGFGAGGDEEKVSFQEARAGRTGDDNGVRVFEGGLAADEFDFVEREIFQDALAFHVHDFALVMHEVVDGEIFFERIVNAVESALL